MCIMAVLENFLLLILFVIQRKLLFYDIFLYGYTISFIFTNVIELPCISFKAYAENIEPRPVYSLS